MYRENLKKIKSRCLFFPSSRVLPIQFKIDEQKLLFDGVTKNLSVISNINQELPNTQRRKAYSFSLLVWLTNPFDCIKWRDNFSLLCIRHNRLFSSIVSNRYIHQRKLSNFKYGQSAKDKRSDGKYNEKHRYNSNDL